MTPHSGQSNTPSYSIGTPSGSNPALFFASPPSGSVPVTEQSVSLEYTTPLKTDPAAVFAAPPSGGVPNMPLRQPLEHSVSSESIQSAHDLFASEPQKIDEVETEQITQERTPIISQEEEKEHEPHTPGNATELFGTAPDVSIVEPLAAPLQPEAELVSHGDDDNAALLEPSPGVYDDSIADMQDVPLSETSPLNATKAAPVAAPAGATAQDFSGLPPPPRML